MIYGGRSFVKVSLSLKQDRNDTYECFHVGWKHYSRWIVDRWFIFPRLISRALLVLVSSGDFHTRLTLLVSPRLSSSENVRSSGCGDGAAAPRHGRLVVQPPQLPHWRLPRQVLQDAASINKGNSWFYYCSIYIWLECGPSLVKHLRFRKWVQRKPSNLLCRASTLFMLVLLMIGLSHFGLKESWTWWNRSNICRF